jgi:hypothetical protein
VLETHIMSDRTSDLPKGTCCKAHGASNVHGIPKDIERETTETKNT